MKNRLYKDLVEYLGLISRLIEEAKRAGLKDEHHKGFITAHEFVQEEIADLLLKADPNRLEATTHQNWDS